MKKKYSILSCRRENNGNVVFDLGPTLKMEVGCNIADIIRSYYGKRKLKDLVGSIVYVDQRTVTDFDLFVVIKEGNLQNVFELAEKSFTNNRPSSDSNTYEGVSYKIIR